MRSKFGQMTMGLLLSATVMQAQNFPDNWTEPFVIEDAPVFHDGKSTMCDVRRAFADGVYYLRPEGAFYQGMRPHNWSYYPVTKIVVQPWQKFTYENCSSSPATSQWSIEGVAVSADENGNFSESIEPIPDGYIDHYLPTVVKDGISYTLGEGHENWGKYHASVAWADSIVEMSVFDPGRIIGKNGSTVYTNFRPLSMTTGLTYNYGTMSIESEGITYFSRGVRQFFEKPMGRLWVEEITIPAISYSEQLIPAGKSLTMTISTTADGITVGDKLCTLTCQASDILSLGTQTIGGNKVQLATLIFRSIEDLIIDEAFVIEIEGFQQEGVDVGLAAALIDPCDRAHCKSADITLQDSWHDDINATVSFTDRVPCISIRGIYDGLKMVSNNSELSLVAPKEGGACTLEGRTTQAQVQLKTAIRWNYGKTNANYTIEGLPSWLHATVDESKRDINGNIFGNGLVTITFTADAVPDNTPERQATLYIKGRGVQTTEPILITQEGTVTDGIVEVQNSNLSDKAVYNLNGQRVDNPRHGLYIINGKKRIFR